MRNQCVHACVGLLSLCLQWKSKSKYSRACLFGLDWCSVAKTHDNSLVELVCARIEHNQTENISNGCDKRCVLLSESYISKKPPNIMYSHFYVEIMLVLIFLCLC